MIYSYTGSGSEHQECCTTRRSGGGGGYRKKSLKTQRRRDLNTFEPFSISCGTSLSTLLYSIRIPSDRHHYLFWHKNKHNCCKFLLPNAMEVLLRSFCVQLKSVNFKFCPSFWLVIRILIAIRIESRIRTGIRTWRIHNTAKSLNFCEDPTERNKKHTREMFPGHGDAGTGNSGGME